MLIGIGNGINNFHYYSLEIMERWCTTFARICVEMDLLKCLLEEI
jgi:hypothetical protein